MPLDSPAPVTEFVGRDWKFFVNSPIRWSLWLQTQTVSVEPSRSCEEDAVKWRKWAGNMNPLLVLGSPLAPYDALATRSRCSRWPQQGQTKPTRPAQDVKAMRNCS